MDIIKELNNFIERALRSRKYLPNVATNYKTPLKWIDPEITDEERQSLEILKKNIDQIFNLLYSKYSDKLSAPSIEVYKKRLKSLIEDYDKYGKDASAMANWSRPVVARAPRGSKIKKEEQTAPSKDNMVIDNSQASLSVPQEQLISLIKHEEILSNGKAIIFTPDKLTKSDIKILQAYLRYLEIRNSGEDS